MVDGEPESPAERSARRRAVRDLVVAGGVTGPRDLAQRLADVDIDASADAIRGDLRALGVVRIAGPDGPVLAVPEERATGGPAGRGPTGDRSGLVAEVTSDPDWKLQAVVLSVVLAFLLAGLVAWLLGP